MNQIWRQGLLPVKMYLERSEWRLERLERVTLLDSTYLQPWSEVCSENSSRDLMQWERMLVQPIASLAHSGLRVSLLLSRALRKQSVEKFIKTLTFAIAQLSQVNRN